MYNFAQLNEKNVCVAVSQLSEMLEMPEMILLEEYNPALLGMKYENSHWHEMPPESEPTPQTTNNQLMAKLAEQEENNLNRDEMMLEQQLMLLNIDLNTSI